MRYTKQPLFRIILTLIAIVLFAGCTSSETPLPPTSTPIPNVEISETLPPPPSTPAPFPTTEVPLPAFSPTPTSPLILPVSASPVWSGDWDVYLSSPILSIVKTVQFQVPRGEKTTISGSWTEGTRPVFFEGELSQDRQTITGQFYNSDVEVSDFTIALAADGLSFSGPMIGEAGNGAFCGTRPGLPRPNPCGRLP